MSIAREGSIVFCADEIARSGDPPQHARNTAANMAADGIDGLALQVAPENDAVALVVREELHTRGRSFGAWAQGQAPFAEIATARRWRADFYVCNIETQGEFEAWSEAALNQLLALALPRGYAVIFTEGAFVWAEDAGLPGDVRLARRQARAARWIKRGFDAIVEASFPDNPLPPPSGGREIDFMLWVAAQMGWPAAQTNVCVYLSRGTPPAHYSPLIGLTGGRWSVWRLGDLSDAARAEVRTWPNISPAPPAPTPAPAPDPNAEAERLAGLIGDALGTGVPLPSRLARAVMAEMVKNWRRGFATQPPLTSRFEAAGAIVGPANVDALWLKGGAGQRISEELTRSGIPRLV